MKNAQKNGERYLRFSDYDLKKILRERQRYGVSEGVWLEFKQLFDNSKRAWVSLLVELVSIANTEGGVVIVGVSDDGELIGCDKELLKSFDAATIRQKLETYSPNSAVEVRARAFNYYNSDYIALCVAKSNNLIVFDKDGNYKEEKGKTKAAFHHGVVYVRKPGGKCAATQTDLDSRVREIAQDLAGKHLARIKRMASIPIESELVAVDPSNPEHGYRIKDTGEAEPVQLVATGEGEVPVSRAIALIRDRPVPVINPGRLRVKHVCKKVEKALGTKKRYRQHQHTQSWKYYGVRPPTISPNPADCRTEFCQYDEPHGDYLYTEKWVEFLIEKLKDDEEYEKVVAYRP
ncbi:ATP-binding protein [bacterium]|nr:ATP-binding protein [bacterium]